LFGGLKYSPYLVMNLKSNQNESTWNIIETNDLYGYSCIVLPLSETNLIEIERLKKVSH
jgi:hypothetical protein